MSAIDADARVGPALEGRQRSLPTNRPRRDRAVGGSGSITSRFARSP
jgi:hypothetical protein